MRTLPGAFLGQWFGRTFPGAPIQPNVAVIHTTEGTGWPDYQGGGTAPHLTLKPNHALRTLEVRQHLPLDRSARALRNEAGGVETNTLNCVQLELVGTCDPATHAAWSKRRIQHVYWPEAPAWALEQLGDVLNQLHQLLPDLPLHSSVTWRPYPASFGKQASQRLSFAEWRRFRGICGHQHVPENSHGDPGNLPIARVLAAALDLNGSENVMPRNRVGQAIVLLEGAARDAGPFRRRQLQLALAILRRIP